MAAQDRPDPPECIDPVLAAAGQAPPAGSPDAAPPSAAAAVSPQPPRRGRPRRWLPGWVAVLLSLLLAVLAGGVAWLGSEAGLRWLAARGPVTVAGARIEVQQPRGSLWSGRIDLKRLQIDTAHDRVVLRDLSLRFVPGALLRRDLHVRSVRIAGLDVIETAPTPPSPPPQLPASLRLPLAVSVDRLRIDRLRVGPADALRDLGSWSAALHYAAARYTLQLQADSSWAQAQLTGSLDADAPFALQAGLAAQHLGGDATAGAALALGGDLRRITTNGALQAGPAKAQVDAVLTPFAALPIERATLRSTALNPAAFDPALPQAALDVRADLGPSSAAHLQGRIQVVNARAGPLDAHRLPLLRLSAQIAGDAQRATASDVVADLGAAGRLTGSLRWQRGQLQARLQASAINARGMQSRLVATRLSGPIEVDADAHTQSVRATLAQPGWDVRLAAQRAGSRVTVSQLRLHTPGGAIDASGRIDLQGAQAFAVQAQTRNLDPAAFGPYPAARLTAGLRASGQAKGRSARIDLRIAPSQWQGRTFTGHAIGTISPTQVRDLDADLRLGDNTLQAQGDFGAAGDTLRWRLDAPALAQLAPELQGRAQGSGTLAGGLAAPRGQIDLHARGLRWGALRLAQLDAAGDFAVAAGAAAPATLSQWLQRLRGRAQLTLADLQWTPAAAAAQAQGEALHVAQAELSAKAEGGIDGPIALQAQLRSASWHPAAARGQTAATQTVQQASLRIAGTGAQHTIALDAQAQLSAAAGNGSAPTQGAAASAEPPPVRLPLHLTLRAEGGWHAAARQWRGRITELANLDPTLPVRLLAPAPLAVALQPLALQVGAASLQLDGGRLQLARLDYADGRLQTAGQVQHVDTARWLQLAGLRPKLARSSLVLSGAWNLDVNDHIDGTVQIQRDSGDVVLTATAQPLPLDIGALVLDVTIRRDQLDGRLVVQSRLGALQASGGFGISKRDGRWGIAGDTPLRIEAGADMPNLDWAAPLLGPDYRLAGRLRLALSGGGTVADPQFSGSVDGSALSFAWAAQGLDLRDGVLKAHFTGDSLRIDQFSLRGGSGRLTASGGAQLRDQKLSARIDFHADKLLALSSPDRTLVLSGSAQAVVEDKTLTLTTALRADRADIALAASSGPTLSSDVVVLGREQPKPEARSGALPTRVVVDARFDFGDDFHIHGKGLDAMLGGTIRVRAQGGQPPVASGTVEVTRGAYTAYGQNLQITFGRLNFNGPLDNPGLNISATRPNLPSGIDVGVDITGTVQRPQVKLTSNPAMPQTQILAWLIMGQPLNQLGSGDLALLQTAAAALLGGDGGPSLTSRVAQAVGLDSISVQSATNDLTGQQESLLTVSKRLSKDLQITFSRGLDGVSSIFGIQYQLTKRLSLRTQAGTENSVDLFYTFEFR